MVDKRGLIRIVEASIGVLIIAGFLFLNFNQINAVSREDLGERAGDILREIADDFLLREAVLNDDLQTVENFASSRVPDRYRSEVRICEIGSVCGKSEFTKGEVFSRERVISSTINELNPKKLKIFIWEEE